MNRNAVAKISMNTITIAATFCLLTSLAGVGCQKKTAEIPAVDTTQQKTISQTKTVSTDTHRSLDAAALQQKVIAEVKAGVISADSNGKAVLPDDLRSACPAGYIYTSRSADCGLMIVFVNAASGDSGYGLLYCEGTIPWQSRTIQVGAFQWHLSQPMDMHHCVVARN